MRSVWLRHNLASMKQRLGGLMKHLCQSVEPGTAEEMRGVLESIRQAIDRLWRQT
jgi:hypothetical protein